MFKLVVAMIGVAGAVIMQVPSTTASRPGATAGRPIVVFVHGRDQAPLDTLVLEKQWYSAFSHGLRTAGLPGLIGASDQTMVFYQTLYRSNAVVRCPADDVRRDDRVKPLADKRKRAETELAAARERAAAAQRMIEFARGRGSARGGVDVRMMEEARESLVNEEKNVTETLGEITVIDAEILSAIDAVLESEQQENRTFRDRFKAAFDKFKELVTTQLASYTVIQQAMLKLVLHDTELYVTERPYRCATNATLARALENAKQSGRPVVLVAHSMGTLVSFDLLKDLDNANPLGDPARLYNISRFVSLGTQLGVDSFIEPFAGFSPPFKVPNSIESWVNLRGTDDFVSPRRVRDAYRFQVPFSEFLIPTITGRPHDIEGYLRSNPTISAIAYGWCRAFAPKTAPEACTAIQDVRAGAGGALVFSSTLR